MGFKLSEHLTKLDYDFGMVSGHTVKGAIPEPSSDAVNDFFADMGESMKTIGIEIKNTEDKVEVAKAMQGLTREQLKQITALTVDALCELTQNNPVKEDLVAAGHRPLQAFLGWLVGELQDPEGSKPGTRTSRAGR